MPCLDENVAIAMVGGRVDPADADAIDDHLADCAACRELVVAAARVCREIDTPSQAATLPAGEPLLPLIPGDRVGRYQIRRALGRGGMGVVHVAYDPDLDREVALKLLRDVAGDDGELRLQREGQAIAKLVHPNVVAVHDIGRDGGRLFIAMELVDGTTLSDWLRERRDWREVVRVLGAAGRGLAAAHRAGLVHRDFKPANVFLGRDGRVKVGDFGLARAPRGPTAQPAAPEASSQIVTREGAVVGTPAYMAPEQIVDGACDAQSDQFGFATVLYEALYGVRPFSGATVAALYERIVAGAPAAESAGRRVPRTLRAAVLRGLAPDPAARHPSMDAMVAAIEPGRGRRGIAIAGGLALIALGVGFSLARSPHPACVRGELAGTWDATHRLAVERAFIATGKAFAPAAAARAIAELDRQADAWSAMHLDVCEAVHARHEQTEPQAALRLVCLGERKHELATVADELARATIETAARVDQVLELLRPLDRCSDLAELTALVPRPDDPATRAVVDAFDARVRDAELDSNAGRWVDGYRKARAIVAGVASVAYAPARARAWHVTGELAERSGAIADAEPALREAALAADAGRDDRARVRSLLALSHVLAVARGKFDDALRVVREAEATIARMGDDPLLTATVDHARGSILHALGKHPEARVALERALAVRVRRLPADHRDIGLSQTELASVRLAQGDFAAAKELLDRAVASRERTVGPTHPDVAALINRRGNVLHKQGNLDAAEASYRRSLAILEAALPANHPEIGAALGNLGMVLRNRRAYDEALAVFERARAIVDATHEGPHPYRMLALYNIGSIQQLRGQYGPARKTFEAGLAMLIALKGPQAPERGAFENFLAQIAQAEKRWADSQRHLEAALAADIAVLGERHHEIGDDYEALGYHYQEQRDLERAAQHYAKALAIKREALGAKHPSVATTLVNLGSLALERKRPADALGHYREALAIEEAMRGAMHADLLWDLLGIGRSLAALGRSAEAIPPFERALALPNADNLGSPACSVRLSLAQAYWATGRRANARALREPTAACFTKAGDTDRGTEARDWFAKH